MYVEWGDGSSRVRGVAGMMSRVSEMDAYNMRDFRVVVSPVSCVATH